MRLSAAVVDAMRRSFGDGREVRASRLSGSMAGLGSSPDQAAHKGPLFATVVMIATDANTHYRLSDNERQPTCVRGKGFHGLEEDTDHCPPRADIVRRTALSESRPIAGHLITADTVLPWLDQ